MEKSVPTVSTFPYHSNPRATSKQKSQKVSLATLQTFGLYISSAHLTKKKIFPLKPRHPKEERIATSQRNKEGSLRLVETVLNGFNFFSIRKKEQFLYNTHKNRSFFCLFLFRTFFACIQSALKIQRQTKRAEKESATLNTNSN